MIGIIDSPSDSGSRSTSIVFIFVALNTFADLIIHNHIQGHYNKEIKKYRIQDNPHYGNRHYNNRCLGHHLGEDQPRERFSRSGFVTIYDVTLLVITMAPLYKYKIYMALCMTVYEENTNILEQSLFW